MTVGLLNALFNLFRKWGTSACIRFSSLNVMLDSPHFSAVEHCLDSHFNGGLQFLNETKQSTHSTYKVAYLCVLPYLSV